MTIEKLIKRIEHIVANPDKFTEELKEIVDNSKSREEYGHFTKETNFKETKFALECLFDKEVSEGRKTEV